MSIVTPDEVAAHWVPKDRSCFYCGEIVAADTIGAIWVDNGSLLLHPDCARRLGTHLMCDSREAELASGRQPWAQRAARAAGAAMASQEARV